jgi:hypothetical protein
MPGETGASGSHSAFFYGTLMHPKILQRVIGNDGGHLMICPAILLVRLSFIEGLDIN